MPTGTLIVGLGRIGMTYDREGSAHAVRSHARAFGTHPAFHVLGGVDPDEERRSRFEREYHAPAFADLDTALTRVQPGLAVIAVPTPGHGAALHTILGNSRPLAVLCEKPLSFDPEEARDMASVCARHDVRLFVNYMRRSDPGVAEVKRRLDCGEIEGPVKGTVWYSKGLVHNGSHFFDLMQHWLGPIRSARVLRPGRLWDGVDPEPDFEATFERGEIVFLAAREEAFSHYCAELVAKNGRLRYEQGGASIGWQAVRDHPDLDGYRVLDPEVEPIASGLDRYQWNVADQLAHAIAGREAHLCDGAAALSTLEALTAILDKR